MPAVSHEPAQAPIDLAPTDAEYAEVLLELCIIANCSVAFALEHLRKHTPLPDLRKQLLITPKTYSHSYQDEREH